MGHRDGAEESEQGDESLCMGKAEGENAVSTSLQGNFESTSAKQVSSPPQENPALTPPGEHCDAT